MAERFRACRTGQGWKVEEYIPAACDRCGSDLGRLRWRTVFYTYYLLPLADQERLAKAAADAMNRDTA